MKHRSLEDLLIHQLRTLRGAHEQLQVSFLKLAPRSASPELRLILENQVAWLENQGERLRRCASSLRRKCPPRTCDAVAALALEGRLLSAKRSSDPRVVDVALVLLAQRAWAYLSASYLSTRALARHGHQAAVVQLLDSSIDELAAIGEDLSILSACLLRPGEVEDRDCFGRLQGGRRRLGIGAHASNVLPFPTRLK